MRTRYFALVMGVIFALIGLAGFIPGLVTPNVDGDRMMVLEGGYGRLFSLFPVNWLHNLFHLAFGIWGIAAYRSLRQAKTFAKTTAAVYAVLTIMGFIPYLWTVFGLVPLFGNDIWLHGVIAIVAGFYGFRDTQKERAAA